MDNEELQKIINQSAGAEVVSILLADTAGDKDLLAAWTLKEKIGAKASLINVSDALAERWRFLLGALDQVKKEVTLSLDVDKNPIEELRYEREGGRLKIYLSPQFPLRAQDFAFEESYHPSDLVVALGFRSKEELKNKLREVPLKNPEAIVTIGRTAAESAPVELPALAPEALKLLARALLRSSLDEELKVFWAFLPKEDFVKTQQTRKLLPELVHRLQALTGFGGLFVILWQDPESSGETVSALLASEDGERLTHIAKAANAPFENDQLAMGPYPTFSEAELEIRKLLKVGA